MAMARCINSHDIAGVGQRRIQWILSASQWRKTMTRSEVEELVRRAEEIYESRLRAILKPEHMDEFVAIEPESGDYFLGKTLNEATRAARLVYPEQLTHAMRIGHRAALHFGLHVR
jgi:hypothetical protein